MKNTIDFNKKTVNKFVMSESMVSKALEKALDNEILTIDGDEEVYAYEKGKWCAKPNRYLKKSITNILNNTEEKYLDDDIVFCALTSINKISKIKSFTERVYENLAIDRSELDNDVNLINFEDCTYDLNTLKYKEHDSADYITKSTNYEISTTENPDVSLWENCIKEWACGDKELIHWLQKFCGYILTGDNREQRFYTLYGSGCNGKTVFQKVLESVLGDYCGTGKEDTLTDSYGDGNNKPRPDLLRFQGKKLITFSEFSSRSKLNESLMKRLTGNDSIVVRKLYGNDYIEFVNTAKILIATNYLPEIKGQDAGIWRRVCPIPFNAIITNKDDKLLDKLLANKQAIFHWMIEGYEMYLREGLDDCKAITDLLNGYKEESDPISDFMKEYVTIEKGEHLVSMTQFYQSYLKYCEKIKEKPLLRKEFKQLIEINYGLTSKHTKKERGYEVKLKE